MADDGGMADGRDRITRILHSMGADRFGETRVHGGRRRGVRRRAAPAPCSAPMSRGRFQPPYPPGHPYPARCTERRGPDLCSFVWWVCARPDPRVVAMLREFMYRYVGEVLKEGQVWAEYRAPPGSRVELDISDIQMAVEQKIKLKRGDTMICLRRYPHKPDACLSAVPAVQNSHKDPTMPR